MMDTLPEHTLREIALWLSSPCGDRVYGQCTPLEHLALARFVSVCRAWRQAALPLLYRTVALDATRSDARAATTSGIRTLQQAVDGGHQRHVRYIRLVVRSFNPDRDWDRQALGAAALVRSCGQMPGVRRVSMYIGPCIEATEPRQIDSEAAERLLCRIADGFDDLISTVLQAMPSIRCIGLSGWYAVPITRGTRQSAERLFARAYSMVGARVTRLSMAGRIPLEVLPASMPECPLRSIEVAGAPRLGASAELIRRSAGSLERLKISGIDGEDVANVFFDRGDPRQEVVVYPRLRHLDASHNPGRTQPAPIAPATNPLPSLEVLRCTELLPFTIATALLGCRARLRVLEIELNAAAVDSLRDGIGAGEDGFTSLDSVSLWTTTEGPALRGLATRLLDLLGLCPRARTVRLLSRYAQCRMDERTPIRLPPTVQQLEAATLCLTVGQAMDVLCSCPHLHTAAFEIVDYPDEERRQLPIGQLVGRHRDKYRGRTVAIRRLLLFVTGIVPRSRRAKLVLLLTDLLPSAASVTVSCAIPGNTEILDDIRVVRKMPPFSKSTHLDRVEVLYTGRGT